MKQYLFSCKCSSLEHIFVVELDKEYAYLAVHLSPLPLHKRIVNAVKYIFGHRCKYGCFEEIILDPSRAADLGDLLINWSANGDLGY